MPIDTRLNPTEEFIKGALQESYGRANVRRRFQDGQIVRLVNRAGVHPDAVYGSLAIVLDDDPVSTTTTVLCYHRNGREMMIPLQSAFLQAVE